MKAEIFAPFVLLRAVDDVRGECINAGVVLFANNQVLVGTSANTNRLKSLHPDFAALNLPAWAAKLQDALNGYAERISDAKQLIAMLPLLCQPFTPDREAGVTQLNESSPQSTLDELLTWQVLPRSAAVRPRRAPSKRQTRLGIEIRKWLKSFNVFSLRMEDLSKNRVVADYPVSVSSGLYADLAVSNHELNVMEVLDLRGMDHLTPGTRGEAAIKGITLDEARLTARPVAIIAASNYGVARPAIQLIQRYAADTYDLGSKGERDRFASFMAKSLNRNDIVSQALEPKAIQSHA